MVLGVEVMRGVGRLLLTNLSSILAGPTSGKVTSSRRTNVKARYESQTDLCFIGLPTVISINLVRFA